ncbi:MAG: type IV pili methyl-accepting chemotaxis transducer N-terminal domain-containing protein [Cyclobacteriaceae bacterium]
MKGITRKYLFILGVLTLVVLGSQMFMQHTISNSESDARIINISGRQRMLSQKITKSALKLKDAQDEAGFHLAQKELNAALSLWKKSHIHLQSGSEDMSVAEMSHSAEVLGLFASVQPHFNNMYRAGLKLVSLPFVQSLTDQGRGAIATNVHVISSNEDDFLSLMNQITFQYDKQASGKIEHLAKIEYYLLAFTILLILVEAFFIFRPIISVTKRTSVELDQEKMRRMDEQELSEMEIGRLKENIGEKDKDYFTRASELMHKYLSLTSQVEQLKKQNEQLSVELQRYNQTA